MSPGQEICLHLRDAIGEKNFRLHEPLLPGARRQARAIRTVDRPARAAGSLPGAHRSEKDALGQVTGFYLMTFDITALKQAQLDADNARRRLRAITDNLPVMISYIDAEQRLQFLNRTIEE